jgi:dTDP-D-glucose 4,6-dehydratase
VSLCVFRAPLHGKYATRDWLFVEDHAIVTDFGFSAKKP